MAEAQGFRTVSKQAQFRYAEAARDGQLELASLYLDLAVTLEKLAWTLERQDDTLSRIQAALHRSRQAGEDRKVVKFAAG